MAQSVTMCVELTIAKSVSHLALPLKTKRRSRKGIAGCASFARGAGPGPLPYFLSGMISYPWARLRNAVGQPLPHNHLRMAASLEDIATVCTVYKE